MDTSENKIVIRRNRIFLLFFAVQLTCLSSLSVGIISTLVANSGSLDLIKSITSSTCILLTSFLWLICIQKSELLKALLQVFVGAILVSLISGLIVNDTNFIITALIFSAIALCLIFPGSLGASLQALILTLNFRQDWLKRLTVVSSIAIVTVIDILLANKVSKLAYFSSLVFGNLLAYLLVEESWKRAETQIANRAFPLLKSWAIALSTVGNTSFYNQDLSHTDFTGQDLANLDLRAKNFYRTCFRNATGLERSRLDNRYFDLDNPSVQQLLTQGTSLEQDLSYHNLQGAYLREANLPNSTLIATNLTLADLSSSNLINSNLTRANLSGADLSASNLQSCILVRTDLTGTNLTSANLTGACIENWNINNRTNFTGVQCDYIYRQLDDGGKPIDRYPRDRNFEPGEFTSLYQEVEHVVELIFKEGIHWRAFAFALQKLQIDDEGMGLQLRGIEKRGDLWVVKITHDPAVPSDRVEQKLEAAYEDLKNRLAAKEQQVNQLLGIVSHQAEALKELSRKPLGNQFFILGSTITNLAGSGQIEYTEAANQIRHLVANTSDMTQTESIVQDLLSQFHRQKIAITESEQVELIQQIVLNESQKDPLFKQFITQHASKILENLPPGSMSTGFQAALQTLHS